MFTAARRSTSGNLSTPWNKLAGGHSHFCVTVHHSIVKYVLSDYCQTATFLPRKPTSGKLQQWLSQTALCPRQSKQNDTQTHTGCPSVWTACSQQDCVSQQRCIHQCQQGHRKTLQTKLLSQKHQLPRQPLDVNTCTTPFIAKRSMAHTRWANSMNTHVEPASTY